MKQQELDARIQKYAISSEIVEFDVLSVDANEEFLPACIRKIVKKFDEYAGLIEGILHPEQSLVGMHENMIFSESEQLQLLELFRKLMHCVREGEVILLKREGYEEFIKKSIVCWQEIKPELLKTTKKLANSWTRTRILKEELEYLG